MAFHDPKNTVVSPGVTALVKSRRACIQEVPETGLSPTELAGGVNRLNTPETEVERGGGSIGAGFARQIEAPHHSSNVVDELLPRKIQVHQTGPIEPATLSLELQSFQTAQLFLNINNAKERRHLVAESTVVWWAGGSIA